MSATAKQRSLKDALAVCAQEPVHIPGCIQPFGVLIACHSETGALAYASENAPALFGPPLSDLWSRHLRDLLGGDIWHAARNTLSSDTDAVKRSFAGLWTHRGTDHAVHITRSGEYICFEIEDAGEMPQLRPEMIREQSFMISQMQDCADETTLFDLTTRLLRHVTGFDRVMIYQFDADFNGEVVAEARHGKLEPYLNLRFPHWDIPEQARAIMAKIDLRLIADAEHEPVPLVARDAALPPLDLSLAQMRGVSPVHIEYLRNMGSAATMTLSVVARGRLWGIISFHHSRPKISSPDIRQILSGGVLPVFCLKLDVLQSQAALALGQKINLLQTAIRNRVAQETPLGELLAEIGPTICETLDISGLMVVGSTQSHGYGATLDAAGTDTLLAHARRQGEQVFATQTLARDVPNFVPEDPSIAGALLIEQADDRALVLLRPELRCTVTWAGDPDAKVDHVDGEARLRPRSSFATYMQEVAGQSKVWSEADISLATQLWPLISVAERQSYLRKLGRQQDIMIGELNHRVRNILALVKSVSSQARRSGGSLDSYSKALESRIHALAAAHDIGAGASAAAVSLRRIIALETEPFGDDDPQRVRVFGPDFQIPADIAPLFTLVIHELMTNAVKYGALSQGEGQIAISINADRSGMALTWKETGGQPLDGKTWTPGFGTTLIRQAVPFEMGGEAHLEMARDGLFARLWVPNAERVVQSTDTQEPRPIRMAFDTPEFDKAKFADVLILEDNFVIAADLANTVKSLGCGVPEIFSSCAGVLEHLETSTPDLALLDINLGRGNTSEEAATMLHRRGVPVVFVTGYGEKARLPAHLSHIPRLSKPVSAADLTNALAILAED